MFTAFDSIPVGRETYLALLAPVAIFFFVWKSVRPDNFDHGGAFRAIGWDLTVLSIGLAFVAGCVEGTRLTQYHAHIVSQADKNLLFLVGVVLSGVAYGTAAWIRFAQLEKSEVADNPVRRMFWGGLSWALGIALCALFGALAEKV